MAIVVLEAGEWRAPRPRQFNSFTIMYFVILVTVLSVLATICYVWIWALLHCRGNQLLDQIHMERWLIFIGITPPVGALIYLYLHRHDPVVLHVHLKR